MSDVLKEAARVLETEAAGILGLKDRLNGNFEKAVDLILASHGRVIASGIGKSGIIARKIMATLNSTGTTSLFLHPTEALHGDLGMVSPGDVVLAISHSGETDELVQLLPVLKEHGATIVAMTGGLNSGLAAGADLVIDCGVEREACPLGLAPTTSTTAALAMGDALAVVLMSKRHFKAADFKRHHPGGKLGERLALSVAQVMAAGPQAPVADPSTPAAQAVEIMDEGDLGTLLVADQGRLVGIFTDGDLRRAVVAGRDLAALTVAQVMTADPLTITAGATAADALQIMEDRLITALPVVEEDGSLTGMVHLHDLLGRGQVSFRNHA